MTASEKASGAVRVQAAINRTLANLDNVLRRGAWPHRRSAMSGHCRCGHPIGRPDAWCDHCLRNENPIIHGPPMATVYADHPDYREEWKP